MNAQRRFTMINLPPADPGSISSGLSTIFADMYPRGAGASSTRRTNSTTAQAFFFLFAFLWVSSSEFVMRTNLIHRQTMKRLVDLPLEASSITQSDRASPMQALSLSASFWPESYLAWWIRSTLSLLWILAFSSKCHLHSALDMQTPGSVMLACWRKKHVYFPFDILRSKLFNYSKFIFSYSNLIYIKT